MMDLYTENTGHAVFQVPLHCMASCRTHKNVFFESLVNKMHKISPILHLPAVGSIEPRLTLLSALVARCISTLAAKLPRTQ